MFADRRRTRPVRDAFNIGRLSSVSVFIRHLLTSVYICVLCSLLLEATSSAILPAKFKHRYSSNSDALRLAIPQASASPMPSADLSSAHISYGSYSCMMAIHTDITRCNNTYHQALNNIIVRGFRKESNRYKRQFCCGYWNRERCMTDATRRKCDKDTFERFFKDQSLYGNEVDTRQSSGISCLGFEKNSPVCSAGSSFRLIAWFTSSPLLTLSALIYYWLTLTYVL